MDPLRLLRWLPALAAVIFAALAVLALVDGRGAAWTAAFGIGTIGMAAAAVPAFARRRRAPSVQ